MLVTPLRLTVQVRHARLEWYDTLAVCGGCSLDGGKQATRLVYSYKIRIQLQGGPGTGTASTHTVAQRSVLKRYKDNMIFRSCVPSSV